MAKMRILRLTLKREWFDQIARGVKKEEYRDYKPYWKIRLEGREYDAVLFRNGYDAEVPEMLVEYRGVSRQGKSRNAGYVIKLGRVIKIKRWRSQG